MQKNNLLVFEYNGTARSGKGTIVSYLAAKNSYTAIEETGVDYRSITRSLISDRLINAQMSSEEIMSKVENLGLDSLTNVVANRATLLAEHGIDSFYQHDVNELVASVGKVKLARKAVKAGFRKRVEAVRDKGEHKILLVDGRDLAKVLHDISDTKLALRTFVTCTVTEAARRECVRSGIDVSSEEGRVVFASIDKRTQADALRKMDPVKPDQDALDYWHPPYGVEQSELGGLAVRTARQIYFDTTGFSVLPNAKKAMLEAAGQMFEDALATVS